MGDAMKKVKIVETKTSRDLAQFLNLSPADGVEIELRSDLNSKIIEVVKVRGLTHAEVAKLASTSRTRMTALLNRNTSEISTDLMLRVLTALGYRAKLTFSKAS
jgi:predicted XRE-type DNA-binding protein